MSCRYSYPRGCPVYCLTDLGSHVNHESHSNCDRHLLVRLIGSSIGLDRTASDQKDTGLYPSRYDHVPGISVPSQNVLQSVSVRRLQKRLPWTTDVTEEERPVEERETEF